MAQLDKCYHHLGSVHCLTFNDRPTGVLRPERGSMAKRMVWSVSCLFLLLFLVHHGFGTVMQMLLDAFVASLTASSGVEARQTSSDLYSHPQGCGFVTHYWCLKQLRKLVLDK